MKFRIQKFAFLLFILTSCPLFASDTRRALIECGEDVLIIDYSFQDIRDYKLKVNINDVQGTPALVQFWHDSEVLRFFIRVDKEDSHRFIAFYSKVRTADGAGPLLFEGEYTLTDQYGRLIRFGKTTCKLTGPK